MFSMDNVKGQLRSIAGDENKTYDTLLSLYLEERLLYRLSISRHAEHFFLHDGFLMYALSGNNTAAPTDARMFSRMLSHASNKLSTVVADICAIQADDAASFDGASVSVQRINEDHPECLQIKLYGRLDEDSQVLKIELCMADKVNLDVMKYVYSSLLGTDGPCLNACSLDTVVAETFVATIVLPEPSCRMRDIFYIYSWCGNNHFDGSKLSSVVKNTLDRKHVAIPGVPTIFSENFRTNEKKNRQWLSFLEKESQNPKLSLSDALSVVEAFLQPVCGAVKKNGEFTRTWSPDGGWQPI